MKARELITVPGIGRPELYSGAARFGDLVWSAGQVPVDQEGETPSDIRAQVELVLDNLASTLEHAGAGLGTLLKVNTYLADLDDFDAYNEVYVERLGEFGVPPRTTVEIARFPDPMRVELEAVAHVRDPGA